MYRYESNVMHLFYTTYLNVCAQLLEDFIDLILEPSTQHLICLIQDKHFDPFRGCEVHQMFQKTSL